MNIKLTRTTILLDNDLVKLAKMKAASENLTLSKFISKLIAENLEKGGIEDLIGAITSSKVIQVSSVKSKNMKGFVLGHP